MTEARTHPIVVEASAPPPAEVPAGADIRLKVKVTCPEGCDLRGAPVTVAVPGSEPVTAELQACEAGSSETADITLKAPRTVGVHAFSVIVPAHEGASVRHEQGALPIEITTIPHGTSLAAWDIPSPVVLGRSFSIKVGAKSSSGCELTGCAIAVCDETGAVVGRGRLQDTPWPGTTALFWAPVDLLAPANEGVSSWSVKFATPDVELPHEGSTAEFSFAVVKPPEHRLTVKVVEKETKAPIEDAVVRAGAFRAATDAAGVAQLQTCKGTFELMVWKAGYESPPQAMEVSGDLTIEIEAVKLPEDDPDSHWTM